jgi:hypothetical protein
MKKLLLLLVAIFSAMVSRAQMLQPDVLSDIILSALESSPGVDDCEYCTISFECNGIVYPASELDAVTVDELSFQLKEKSPHHRFRYAAPFDREYQSRLNYANRYGIKLPCRAVNIYVVLSDSLETHVRIQRGKLHLRARYYTLDEKDCDTFTFASANMERSSLLKAQQPSKVECFSDITRHVNNTKCRHTRVWSRINGPNEAEMKFDTGYGFAGRYAQMMDESGIVNYDCDTLYIYSSTYLPSMSTQYQIKCNKGIYNVTDEGLEPTDFSTLQSSEELFEVYKSYPEAYEQQRTLYEYHPFSYESAMVKYTCWDDARLVRNLDNVSDTGFGLLRIIIHNHEVVYFDVWSW